MAITRSMTRRRREAAVDEPPIAPSGRRETAVPLPLFTLRRLPRVHRESKSGPKRKSRLMPLVDLSINYKGPKHIKEMLRKQHARVMKYLKRDKTGEKEINLKHVKTTPSVFTKYATPEDETEALTKCGVIWGGGRPPLTKKNFLQSQKYSRSELLEIVLEMVIQNRKLPHGGIVSLLSLNRMIRHKFISCKSLLETLDLRGMTNVGDHLVAALSQPRYQGTVKHINLEGAQDIEDKHLTLVKKKVKVDSLLLVESLNLDGCQNISNRGVKDITSVCLNVHRFSICENLLVTDYGIKILMKNCPLVAELNLSGCKKITDDCLVTISTSDVASYLVSLNISKCEQVTDVRVIAIVESCPILGNLSLFGIPGVTLKCLDILAANFSDTMTTLDVNCCSGLEGLSQEKLLHLFPYLESSSS